MAFLLEENTLKGYAGWDRLDKGGDSLGNKKAQPGDSHQRVGQIKRRNIKEKR